MTWWQLDSTEVEGGRGKVGGGCQVMEGARWVGQAQAQLQDSAVGDSI